MKRTPGQTVRGIVVTIAALLTLGGCVTYRTTDFNRDQMVGVVYAEDGTPVVGAEIRVDRLRRGTSDAFGRFRIDDIPAGERTLTITAPGYETARTVLRVENRTQLVRVDLMSHEALTDLAITAVEQHHWARAASVLERMIAIDPQDERTVLVQRILAGHGPAGGTP